ncbi:UDP-3-O-[3-hydroxymyristoyl] N-acetylglucosamine deacetylase [Chlorella sorokiniana]|uniref:UDP-3-O-acyl-N-acetylglucosamine deacetylase n=1 Tax=Chlorella sorokiniana TaxID=3076 RepID=A0A2P6TDL0_CHLSO|nr:UDP-3-O-[3-hydroxymyristoyl] N-acetylglucosamine deacetylase [Chlorella sorokiniana]|eukprot:PRW20734.1 UDP-3-O-[3-hydroxymyristoyl] N-acetylglucosamine deacetylase [Chlorella sorokiniana]
MLGSPEGAAVWGTEHLLAALECCGVHNARIEVEGGKEMPIIDGSALGWASEILRAGVQVALDAAGEEASQPSAGSLQEVFTVQDGESFISFYPSQTARVTVGVDYTADAPVIGQQWFSWSPEANSESDFISLLAPARTCFASVEQVLALREEGLLQAGPDYVSIVGNNQDWYLGATGMLAGLAPFSCYPCLR